MPRTPAKAGTDRRVYRRRKPARPRRRPVAGLLEPRQTLMVTIDPPLEAHEQPVALTPNGGDIMLLDATVDSVTVRNETDRVVAYVVAVAPRVLVKAASMPWKRIASDLGHAFRESGMLERFARLWK